MTAPNNATPPGPAAGAVQEREEDSDSIRRAIHHEPRLRAAYEIGRQEALRERDAAREGASDA